MLVLYTFTVFPCAIVALIFLGTTVWNICLNRTTYDKNVRSGVSMSRGVYRNMTEVFGPPSLSWVLPTMVEKQLMEVEMAV